MRGPGRQVVAARVDGELCSPHGMAMAPGRLRPGATSAGGQRAFFGAVIA